MKIEDVIKIFKKGETKNINDSRTIIKYKNNTNMGIELGVILSKIDDVNYEVFIHSKINKEIISQILYKTFINENQANDYYEELEQYIVDFNIDKITDIIQKGI